MLSSNWHTFRGTVSLTKGQNTCYPRFNPWPLYLRWRKILVWNPEVKIDSEVPIIMTQYNISAMLQCCTQKRSTVSASHFWNKESHTLSTVLSYWDWASVCQPFLCVCEPSHWDKMKRKTVLSLFSTLITPCLNPQKSCSLACSM